MVQITKQSLTNINGVNIMDEWKVGDPADWGDHVGVPDIPYMGYLNNEDDKDIKYNDIEENGLAEEARKLYERQEYLEALTKINLAIFDDRDNAQNWNLKGLILCELRQFEDSKRCFDESLRLKHSDIVIGNKAYMYRRWAWKYYDENDPDKAMELCTKAISLVKEHDTNENMEDYEFLKRWIEAKFRQRDCYNKQKRKLQKIGRKNLIMLSKRCGLNKGQRLKLVRCEDEIEVYADGEKKCSVTKYDFSEEGLVSIASELEDLPEISYAEYVFPYRDKFIIAKLLR